MKTLSWHPHHMRPCAADPDLHEFSQDLGDRSLSVTTFDYDLSTYYDLIVWPSDSNYDLCAYPDLITSYCGHQIRIMTWYHDR